MNVELTVVADPTAAAEAAAALLVDAVQAGRAIGLSGGSTPGAAYRRAAELEPDWSRATLWLVDERCVTADDERSNARLVRETILDTVAEQPEFHGVDTSLEPERAAAAYDDLLRSNGVPSLVFLGIGSDGHTASLFPGMPAVAERARLAVSTDAGLDPFVTRVTFTLRAIAAAEHVVFLVTGESKAEQVRHAFAQPASEAIPASLARSGVGRTTLIADTAAAALLTIRAGSVET